MNGEDGVRATVADMHHGDIVCAHAGLPETMNDAQDAARTGAESPEPAARTVAGPLDAAIDTGRSDGAPDAARTFAGPLDAASDTGAGPLRGVDDASQLRDVLLFCSEI